MADPILDRATARAAGAAAIQSDPILKRASVRGIARDAASNIGRPVSWLVNQLGDRIDAIQAAAMEPITTKFATGQSEPIGQALKDLALAPITGNPPSGYTRGDASYESGVRAGLKPWQARTLAIAGSFPAAGALNMAGEAVALPAARGLANLELKGLRARTLPGVKQYLDFRKPGATLPNAYREGAYEILRTEEGQANFRKWLRQKQLKGALKLSRKAQDEITEAIETGTVDALPAVQREAAEALVNEFSYVPLERAAKGGRKFALSEEAKVGYVPRYPEKPKGGRFGAPGLSTSPGEMRTAAGRLMTTKEVEAATGVKFKSAAEAAMIHGEIADTKIMHMGIVGRLAEKHGRPVRPGDIPISKIEGVPGGFTPEMQAKLEATALPKELHELVTKLNERMKPEEWGRFSQFMRTVNDHFKRWALASGGTASRNLQNNIVVGAIDGNVNPANWIWAERVRNKMRSGKLSRVELAEVEDAMKGGALGHGFQEAETGGKGGRALASRVYNALPRAFRGVNSWIEDVSRLAQYRFYRQQGMGPVAAGAEVDKVLGNYSPRFQSKGFAALRRSWWPFINWDLTIPEVFGRLVLKRPGSVGQVGRTLSNISKATNAPPLPEDLPDYLREENVVPVGQDKYYSPQAFGPFSIQSTTGAAAEDVTKVQKAIKGEKFYGSSLVREGASKTYPIPSVMYAVSTGRDPLTGYVINDWRRFFESRVPLFRAPRLLADLQQGKPGAKQRLISYLAGLREVERK